jgi:hypothetical protein
MIAEGHWDSFRPKCQTEQLLSQLPLKSETVACVRKTENILYLQGCIDVASIQSVIQNERDCNFMSAILMILPTEQGNCSSQGFLIKLENDFRKANSTARSTDHYIENGFMKANSRGRSTNHNLITWFPMILVH